MMKYIFACLCQWFISSTATASKEQMLLNGSPFPSTLYVPLHQSYRLECQSASKAFWKIYLKTGKLTIVHDRLVRLTEFDHDRDGFYQCYLEEHPRQFHSVFIFSTGARAIDRQWTHLTEFHPDLLTVCRPSYFNYGYNEQFIELIDSQQMVRYNRSALLVKHIRSTTHLFCKLYLDTPTVAVRVQTLIKPGSGLPPLLSDQNLRTNDYLDFNTDERDVHRIAFAGMHQRGLLDTTTLDLGDSTYFHCPTKATVGVHWHFLSWNYYAMKTLPTLHHTDAKLTSLTIDDAGMYTCQLEKTIQKRFVLTILHAPRASNHHYEQSLYVDWNTKYLICCHLDAVPYPTYSWTMKTEVDERLFVWCSKRCCWLHIIYREYQHVVCTSANQFGTAKYTVRLVVQTADGNGRLAYGEPTAHSHHADHHHHLNLFRVIEEKKSTMHH